tara:strand:+ start:221 stop:697 length:477 start_codon:yes stop_codon:yes gene_type:complete
MENSLDIGVTCYSSRFSTWVVFCGSFLWFLVLGVFNGVLIATAADTWSGDGGYKDGVLPFYAISFGFHVGVFFLQTVDAMYLDRTFWPLQALIWSMQLTTIAFLIVTTAYSLALDDRDRFSRTAVNAGALVGQIVSTSCHIAVVLEYLFRSRRNDLQT